jgi:hypothetical protein
MLERARTRNQRTLDGIGRVFLILLKVGYVTVLGAVLLVILHACLKHGADPTDDSDHLLILVGALTGPSGFAPVVVLSLPAILLFPSGFPASGAFQFIGRYENFIAGVLMAVCGYLQWFWLVPKLWRYLRRGRREQ